MIAISYRREDSSAVTGRLYDRLQVEFGKRNVFMDFDSIPFGVDFREKIKQTLERARVVVAVVGPSWAGARETGPRRIDDPTDFVRIEIAAALQRGIPVIPVLLNQTVMPGADDLPDELRPFAYRNALVLDTGVDFHHHADRLIAGIHALVKNGHARKPKGRLWRIGLLVIFIIAVATSIWGLFARKNASTETRAPTSVSLPSSSPSVPVPAQLSPRPNVPTERYAELKGKWLIREQVLPNFGGEEITWNYEGTVLGNQLTMTGRKIAVVEAGSNPKRELQPDEKATISIYTLTLQGLEAGGTSDEKDPQGHIYSTLKIQFSENLQSLSGNLETGGRQVSTLYGSKQQ